jgi:hypothetical protein
MLDIQKDGLTYYVIQRVQEPHIILMGVTGLKKERHVLNLRIFVQREFTFEFLSVSFMIGFLFDAKLGIIEH